MTELYRKIYRMSIDTWAGDYNQDYAHITNEFWTRSISSSGSSSTTKLSGAFVTSVTLDGFGRSHEIQFLDNGGNTIASPYDTTALKAQLATAKRLRLKPQPQIHKLNLRLLVQLQRTNKLNQLYKQLQIS